MKPDKDLEKSIYYDRKATSAWYNNHKIKEFIYKKLSQYYEQKHIKKIFK